MGSDAERLRGEPDRTRRGRERRRTTGRRRARRRARAAQPLQLVFPLKANDAGLEGFANAVSTPGAPMYGRYESVQTLAGRFGATPATRARVLAYLRANGARDATIDPTGLLAEATLDAATAERLFGTRLARYRARGARFIAPAAAVAIPPALQGLVDGVVGLDTEPVLRDPLPALRQGPPAAAHAAAGQPSSALPLQRHALGVRAGRRASRFTPEPIPDRVRLQPGACSPPATARATDRADRDRWLQYSDLKRSRAASASLPAITRTARSVIRSPRAARRRSTSSARRDRSRPRRARGVREQRRYARLLRAPWPAVRHPAPSRSDLDLARTVRGQRAVRRPRGLGRAAERKFA